MSFSIEIRRDDDPESPRDWDNLGTMICFHKKYTLGDDSHKLKHEDFDGWASMEAFLRKDHGAAVVLPLFLIDHSGLSMSTKDFADPWDSGQVGFIYVTKERALKEYGVKRLSPKQLAKITEVLKSEVATYDQYLRGDVWGYVIKDKDGDEAGSCWGHYGHDYCVDEAMRELGGLLKDS